MNILFKTIGWVCAIWAALCLFAVLGMFKEGKVGAAIVSFFIFDLFPAIISFYSFKHSHKYTEEWKRKIEEERILLEQQNEIRRKQRIEEEAKLANEMADRERLETEQKEKDFQEFKNKYPNYWQNILDKKLVLDMTLEMVTMIHGEPHNRKESVSKTKTTEKYYFHPYQNAQRKTSYQLEVTFENGLVSAWKEL